MVQINTHTHVHTHTHTHTHTGLSTHNYGVIIDAGSSGSKVQLFHWPPHNGDPAKLLQIESLTDEFGAPLMMKTEPGTVNIHKLHCPRIISNS